MSTRCGAVRYVFFAWRRAFLREDSATGWEVPDRACLEGDRGSRTGVNADRTGVRGTLKARSATMSAADRGWGALRHCRRCDSPDMDADD